MRIPAIVQMVPDLNRVLIAMVGYFVFMNRRKTLMFCVSGTHACARVVTSSEYVQLYIFILLFEKKERKEEKRRKRKVSREKFRPIKLNFDCGGDIDETRKYVSSNNQA